MHMSSFCSEKTGYPSFREREQKCKFIKKGTTSVLHQFYTVLWKERLKLGWKNGEMNHLKHRHHVFYYFILASRTSSAFR